MTRDIPKLRSLLETFDAAAGTEERTALLIDYAERFREVGPEIATRPFPEENKIPYCESEAYVWMRRQEDGTVRLYFAVENPSGISAKALAAILDRTLSGSPPEDLLGVSPDIVQRIFRQNISMGKGLGLTAMVQAVQALARHHLRAKSPGRSSL